MEISEWRTITGTQKTKQDLMKNQKDVKALTQIPVTNIVTENVFGICIWDF